MKRWRGTGIVLLAGALALTGCGRDGGSDTGSGGNSGAATVASGKATGTIRVWAMGTEGEKLGALAKDFEKANPKAHVKITAVPWDAAHDKIATAVAAGTTPDVSLVGTTWMGEFAKTGGLDKTPPNLFDQGSFFPGAWDSTVVDGTSYGVPWYVETRLIYYRKDLAKKAGVSEPKTWAGLTSFASTMQRKAGCEQGLYMQPADPGTWQTFMPFAWQAGARLTDSSGHYTLDSPEMAKALKYYASFFSDGISSKKTPAPGELESGFIKGDICAFVSGPWHVGILRDQGGAGFLDKVGVAQMPTGKVNASFAGGGDLAVFKDAKNRAGAWKLVRYLAQPQVQQKWYQTVADLPAVQDAWDTGQLQNDPKFAAFGTQLQTAKAPPSVPTWEQVASVIDTQIEDVVRGGESPSAAAKAMQSKAASIGTGS